MKNLKYFAFDQDPAKPGCEYTEFYQVGPESYGWVAGSNEKCGVSYYARQPYVIIPAILVIVVIISAYFLIRRKKAK